MSEESAAPTAAPADAAPAEPVAPAIEPGSDASADAAASGTSTEPSDDASAAGDAAPSGQDTPAEIVDVKDYIRQGLAEIEQGTSSSEESATKPAKAAAPAPAKEAAPDAEKPSDETVTEEKATDAETAAEEKAKDKTPTLPQVKFKSREEIDVDFARVPKEARAVMAEYAEAGTELQKHLDKLGGVEFIQPLSKIVEGVQEGDNMPIFSGLLEAGGIDSFAAIVDDLMGLTMVEVLKNKPTNAGEKRLHDQLVGTCEHVIQAMFGDDTSVKDIFKLVKYNREGHLNTADVDKYFAENPDATEVPSIETDVRVRELEAEVAKLKGDKAADDTKPEDEAAATAAADGKAEFQKALLSNTHPVLESELFGKSILRAATDDNDDVREAKKAARALIRTAFDSALITDPRFKKLRAGAQKGEATTANYKRSYAGLVNAAVDGVRIKAAPLEAAFAMLSGGKRNASIVDRQKRLGDPAANGNGNGKGEPTIPDQRTPDQEKMSEKEWHERLKREVTAIESGN